MEMMKAVVKYDNVSGATEVREVGPRNWTY